MNNKSILRITNLNTTVNITPNDFLDKLGGDIRSIRSLLQGYCDLNILAEFSDNQNRKIRLLPSPPEKSIVENDIPNGFTYELVFYNPLRFLLIDNGDTNRRIKKGKTIIENQSEYKEILTLTTGFQKNEYSIKNFNGVFIHASNPEYELLHSTLLSDETPMIVFGGEITTTDQKSELNLKVSDSQFYNNLEKFLSETSNTFKISFAAFLGSKESTMDKEEQIKSLALKIQDEEYDLNNLPKEIQKEIFEIVGRKVEFPRFINPQELIDYLIKVMK